MRNTGEKDLNEKMNLLFYAAKKIKTGKLLWNLHQGLASEYEVAFCQTIDTLSLKLRKSLGELTIAILLAESQEELLDLLALRDLFWNLRIILIIPDRKSETVAMGHMLRPRFLSYADGDFSDVAAVLEKMLGHLKINDNEQKGGEPDGEKNLKHKSGCLSR